MLAETKQNRQQMIARLNDDFRNRWFDSTLGSVYLTQGVRILVPDPFDLSKLMAKVAGFDGFIPDNDPYGEHDFGTVRYRGEKLFWKIDYYDPTMTHGSEDPADPTQTHRVMTIMLAEEY